MNLRPATRADSDLLYEWRTEGETADWYEGPQTSVKDHDAWLYDRLDNPCVHIWIVEVDGIPVGVVRLDSNDELSIEIAPNQRGKGLGTEAIEKACELAPGRVKANVDWTNREARKAFTAAGFVERPDVIFFLYRP